MDTLYYKVYMINKCILLEITGFVTVEEEVLVTLSHENLTFELLRADTKSVLNVANEEEAK